MNINFFIIFVLICFIFLSDTLFCIFSMSTVKILYLREELKYKRKDNKTEINPNSHIVIPINNGFLFYFKHLISTFPRYFDYRLSRVPSHHFRYFVYRHVYHVSMAEKVVIYHGTEIRSPFLIKIGKGTVIGDNAILDGRNGIVIGENVNFSSNVSIWTEQHDHRDAYFRCETQRKKPVVIHNRAWIGPNTILLHSIEIGEGAVVAAGSVVTKSVEPYTIVAGVPAKKIGERSHDLRYEFDGTYCNFI